MSSRTSAFRGLALVALSVLGFAACENKTVQPNPPIAGTLTVTPAGPVTLNAVNQTVTLVASTTGLTSPVVTYVSSTPAVASVNATTGVVTALTNGTTTVTATATGTDNLGTAQTLRQAVQIIVSVGGNTTPPGQTQISIQRITNQAGQDVDVTNVSGQINIVMNVDVPTGVRADSVVVFDGTNRLCVQRLTSGSAVDAGLSAEGAEVPVTIVCSVNSAALGANGLPNLLNGSHVITAAVFAANVRTASATDFPIVLNNNNFISAVVTTSRGSATGGTNPGPGNLATAGSLWNAGDVVVTLSPVIYNGSANNVASATVSLTTSGRGVTGVTGCTPTFTKTTDPTIAAAQGGAGAAGANAGATPNCPSVTAAQSTSTLGTNGVLTVTFPEANVMNSTATGGNGVKNVEDLITITVNSVTTAGQPGPTCINPNPATNPQNPTVIGGTVATCGNGFFINPVTGNQLVGNQLRLDNLAPRVTNFDITPTTLQCSPNASCYISNPATISNGFTSVDYGVDSQTAAFFTGTTGTTPLPTAFTTANETATSSSNVAAVAVVDKLGNSSTRFASTTPGNTVATATTAGVQTLGIDVTAPTCAYVNTPTSAVVTANEINPPPASNQFALTFIDQATPPAGPSGFPTFPVTRSLIGQTPAGNTCIIGTGTACTPVASAGTAVGGPAAGAQFGDQFNGGAVTNQYNTYTPTVRDVAGNVCSPTNGGATIAGATTNQRIALYDTTNPAVGGVVAPSTISGGQSASFSATATDNLDLGTARPSETYGAVIPKLAFPTVTVGTFGPDVFTTSANVVFTDPSFMRSVETTNPATGAPSGAVQPATAVNLDVLDIAGNVASTAQNITVNVAAGSPSGFSTYATSNPALQTFTLTASNTTICNNTTPANCVNPTSTVLTANAVGPASTFNNPFVRVNFYYNDANGISQLIGTGVVGVTDNTITNKRTWSYTVTWTPTALAVGNYVVFAVGVDAAGNGLQTPPATLAISAT